jgi:hypothetical protein
MEKTSPTCFSDGCGMCSRCSGDYPSINYTHPDYGVEEKIVKTNWAKYQDMLNASEQYRSSIGVSPNRVTGPSKHQTRRNHLQP